MSMLEVLEKLKKCEMQANLKKKWWKPRETKNQSKAISEVESTSEDDEDHEETEIFEIIEAVRFQRGCK